MNEEAIEQLKNALREVMQIIVNRGEPLSEELKVLVAQAMEHIANRIQQLRQEGETDTGVNGLPPEIEPSPHASSNINGFKYDPESGQLVVKFQDKYPGTDGPIYSYSGVPKNIYDVFARGAVAPKTSGSNDWHTWKEGVTPSHGAAMHALIKQGGFPYQKVS